MVRVVILALGITRQWDEWSSCQQQSDFPSEAVLTLCNMNIYLLGYIRSEAQKQRRKGIDFDYCTTARTGKISS